MNTDLLISHDNFPEENVENWETFDNTDLIEDHSDISKDVEIVVSKLSHRGRQITAKIQIPHPIEKIWQILTDYESLPNFIPNLAQSRRLTHPDDGIRLEQVGSQKLLNFKFCARVVLDLEEVFPQLIKFNMVEGDFKDFQGSWCLEPYSVNNEQGTTLCYTISIVPKLTMPVSIIECRLKKDLQTNLLAIRDEASKSVSIN